MSDFDATFRALVIPRLAKRCILEAHYVAEDEQSFSEACRAVMVEALRLGASHLTEANWRGLHDWIDARVLSAVDASDKLGDEVRRQEHEDPVAHYSALAVEAPHLTWIFAAISPEYRRHLLRERPYGGR